MHTGVLKRHLLVRQLTGYHDLVQLCVELVHSLHHRCVLDHAVSQRHAVRAAGRLLRAFPSAEAELAEGGTEFLRHSIVDDGVDCAVDVDTAPTEEDKPGIHVGLLQEGVYHHQGAVWHPQHSEQDHHHSQHLGHLRHGRDSDYGPLFNRITLLGLFPLHCSLQYSQQYNNYRVRQKCHLLCRSSYTVYASRFHIISDGACISHSFGIEAYWIYRLGNTII